MKKSLCIFLTVILAVTTVIPALSVSAADTEEQIGLIKGTYAPHQVVVMFKDNAVDADAAPRRGGLAAVGEDFGEMMSAISSEDKAIAAAYDETNIIAQSLGDDFVLEDTLVFADDDASSDRSIASVGACADADQSGDLTIALVSSEKYDTAEMIRKLGKPIKYML